MMRPMPASIASRSSASPLLLPWKWQRAAGKPAASATASSPPETMSRPMPSSRATLAMKRLRYAFDA